MPIADPMRGQTQSPALLPPRDHQSGDLQLRKQRQGHRSGSLFLEATITLAVIATIFGLLAWRQAQAARDARDVAASSHLRLVQQHASLLLRREFSALLASPQLAQSCDSAATSCPAGSLTSVLPTQPLPGTGGVTLAAASGLLPGFSFRSPHGQGYRLLLRRTGPEQIEAIVVTTGGTTLPDVRVAAIAVGADPGDGGAILAATPARVTGGYGTWSLDLAPYQAAGVALPGAGHAAVLVRLDGSQIVADYLYRTEMPGQSGTSTMFTHLDMGQHAINNASELQVRHAVRFVGTPVEPGTACQEAGRLTRTATGGSAMCADGAWHGVALVPNCAAGAYVTAQAGVLTCAP